MRSYRALTGVLTARTAIHIGSGAGRDVTDALCRRDVAGNYLLTGMALGGALRTLATRLAPRLGAKVCRALWSPEQLQKKEYKENPCGCEVCGLFGEVNPREETPTAEGGRAARLAVAHAPLHSATAGRIRDGVGLGRVSRVAASGVKFDLEILPAGVQFDLRLELDETDALQEQILAAALAEWQAGRAWLGGRVARGLGAFELSEVRCVTCDLWQDDSLLAFLGSDKPWKEMPATPTDWPAPHLKAGRKEVKPYTASDGVEGIAHSYVALQFDLVLDGPFLTGDTVAAVRSGFDHAPLLDIVAQEGRPVLPGASLRGVLRSQAERIARTLATLDAARETDDDKAKDAFLRHCPACDPLETDADQPLTNCDTLLSATTSDKKKIVAGDEEAKNTALCLACRLFGSTRRGSRFLVTDAVAQTSLTDDARKSPKALDFLAIDRFTGGGRDGAKFDALAAWRPVFRVQLHLENPAVWELGWLTLVLRDLHEGWLTVGFGAAKGFGRGTCKELEVTAGVIHHDDWNALGLTAPADKEMEFSGLYRVRKQSFDTAPRWKEWLTTAQGWVDAFHTERQNITRADGKEQQLPRLKTDSFFGTESGTEAKKLYGKARAR